MTNDVNDMNARIIEEFRNNAGNVGGPFEGRNMLLLHNIGAGSGTERLNPLVYQELDGNFAIFASKGGAPTNPAWYYNLVANPEVTIEVGTESVAVRARVAEREERDEIWERQKQAISAFADYEAATDRIIPVVVLEPR
jgi:deazaflavin-dependent oxidoreductase (nitroreductase family)